MDPRTVAMMLLITGIECSLLFFAAGSIRRQQSGRIPPTLIWGIGTAIFVIGAFFLLFQGRVTPWIGIMLANAAITLGQMLTPVGIRRLAGLKLALPRYGMYWLAYNLLAGILTFLFNSTPARIILFSLVLSSIYVEAMILTLGFRRRVKGLLVTVIAATFGVLGAFFLLRAIMTVTAPPDSVFSASALNVATFVVTQAGLVAWGLGLILLQGRLAELDLERAYEEKAVLLRELQHRIKNSIGIISSLVTLESKRLNKDPDTDSVLSGLQDRITAIGSLYDQLYRTGETERIELDIYLEAVADSLYTGLVPMGKGIGLELALEKTTVEVKSAVPLGIIANELLTDSFKHAFPDGRQGTVQMSLSRDGKDNVLVIRDDGVGLPPEWGTKKGSGMGLVLTELLAEQVGGYLSAVTDGGARFTVRFPA